MQHWITWLRIAENMEHDLSEKMKRKWKVPDVFVVGIILHSFVQRIKTTPDTKEGPFMNERFKVSGNSLVKDQMEDGRVQNIAEKTLANWRNKFVHLAEAVRAGNFGKSNSTTDKSKPRGKRTNIINVQRGTGKLRRVSEKLCRKSKKGLGFRFAYIQWCAQRGVIPPIFSKMQESWSKVGHAAGNGYSIFRGLFFFFLSINSSWSNGQNAPHTQ